MGSKVRRIRRAAGIVPPSEVKAARRASSDGSLIVYGAGCCWWDSIDKAGRSASGLPCCPHCGSMLFETTETEWWSGAAKQDVRERGYVSLLSWARGRCFRTWADARAACRAEQESSTPKDRGAP